LSSPIRPRLAENEGDDQLGIRTACNSSGRHLRSAKLRSSAGLRSN